MYTHIPPVSCPHCDERQNAFDAPLPHAFIQALKHGTAHTTIPDGLVGCMVCGHRFKAQEYTNELLKTLTPPHEKTQ